MKNNKIVIGLVLVAIALAGVYVAAADSAAYTLTVNSAQNTAFAFTSGTFGAVNSGVTSTIANTFTLDNTGNIDAHVTAAFTTGYDASSYGMNNSVNASAADVILGTTFELKSHDGTFKALGATSAGVEMTDHAVKGHGADVWSIEANVPAGQNSGSYTGTIEITFANV